MELPLYAFHPKDSVTGQTIGLFDYFQDSIVGQIFVMKHRFLSIIFSFILKEMRMGMQGSSGDSENDRLLFLKNLGTKRTLGLKGSHLLLPPAAASSRNSQRPQNREAPNSC